MSRTITNKKFTFVANCIAVPGLLSLSIFWYFNWKFEVDMFAGLQKQDRILKSETRALEKRRALADAEANNMIKTNYRATSISNYYYSPEQNNYPPAWFPTPRALERAIKSKQGETIVYDDSEPYKCIGVVTSKVVKTREGKPKAVFFFIGSNNSMEAQYAVNLCKNHNR
ncbi:hypothetical protein [Moorena sp. SIO3A2]|uniref:hypothetical protein n=1 Tax=Moorena sp. SIO3A2 TaxID=2607841 RepID=UPI0013BBB378|nr:hypothetical protein [Moorena sp. SIO3A2]NER90394.1 hypothetical protein [Moorena sp. SIO3A2]